MKYRITVETTELVEYEVDADTPGEAARIMDGYVNDGPLGSIPKVTASEEMGWEVQHVYDSDDNEVTEAFAEEWEALR